MKGTFAVDLVFPDRLSQKELQERIAEADREFEHSLLKIANDLAAEKDLLLLGLTGPTCSGKTTAAKMLTRSLFRNGRNVHVISIDDFYYEKKHLLLLSKESGIAGLDYDSEKTIDTALLQDCLFSLLAGKPTFLPHFNFLTGLRECGVCLAPRKGDLFLFEGIQVLYPNVDAILQRQGYKNIAICPQSGITVGGRTFLPNEIRLMRRLVRDVNYRGIDASFTFFLWNSVRENEEKNIFPNLNKCDQTVNSSMPYEIGVLKPYLIKYLSQMDPGDLSASKAEAILSSLQNVESVDSAFISPNSLYREFI